MARFADERRRLRQELSMISQARTPAPSVGPEAGEHNCSGASGNVELRIGDSGDEAVAPPESVEELPIKHSGEIMVPIPKVHFLPISCDEAVAPPESVEELPIKHSGEIMAPIPKVHDLPISCSIQDPVNCEEMNYNRELKESVQNDCLGYMLDYKDKIFEDGIRLVSDEVVSQNEDVTDVDKPSMCTECFDPGIYISENLLDMPGFKEQDDRKDISDKFNTSKNLHASITAITYSVRYKKNLEFKVDVCAVLSMGSDGKKMSYADEEGEAFLISDGTGECLDLSCDGIYVQDANELAKYRKMLIPKDYCWNFRIDLMFWIEPERILNVLNCICEKWCISRNDAVIQIINELGLAEDICLDEIKVFKLQLWDGKLCKANSKEGVSKGDFSSKGAKCDVVRLIENDKVCNFFTNNVEIKAELLHFGRAMELYLIDMGKQKNVKGTIELVDRDSVTCYKDSDEMMRSLRKVVRGHTMKDIHMGVAVSGRSVWSLDYLSIWKQQNAFSEMQNHHLVQIGFKISCNVLKEFLVSEQKRSYESDQAIAWLIAWKWILIVKRLVLCASSNMIYGVLGTLEHWTGMLLNQKLDVKLHIKEDGISWILCVTAIHQDGAVSEIKRSTSFTVFQNYSSINFVKLMQIQMVQIQIIYWLDFSNLAETNANIGVFQVVVNLESILWFLLMALLSTRSENMERMIVQQLYKIVFSGVMQLMEYGAEGAGLDQLNQEVIMILMVLFLVQAVVILMLELNTSYNSQCLSSEEMKRLESECSNFVKMFGYLFEMMQIQNISENILLKGARFIKDEWTMERFCIDFGKPEI